jgi:hypothetical protein
MSDKSTRTLRSESSAVSLNLELSNLEHALRGASLLAELLANHNLPDEESRRMHRGPARARGCPAAPPGPCHPGRRGRRDAVGPAQRHQLLTTAWG